MITIKIDEEDYVDMLMNRLEQWNTSDDEIVTNLYYQMYHDYAYNGCFEGIPCSVAEIVDNDWVNYCDVLGPDDDHYAEIAKIYEEQGIGDCSCEDEVYSYIEAEEKGYFLVRY